MRFATNAGRVEHIAELRGIVEPRLRSKRRDAWIPALRAAGVPCGSVRDVAEVLADPQLTAREMIAAVEHATAGTINVLGVPIKLSEAPGGCAPGRRHSASTPTRS